MVIEIAASYKGCQFYKHLMERFEMMLVSAEKNVLK
jgi:hypothetical protein